MPIDLIELYLPTETSLLPENAVKRWASTEVVWYGWLYERQAVSRGDVSRYIDGRFNSVSITLSNVDRDLSTWLSSTDIEGYRVIVRMISRRVDNDSIVLFVGRCEKPYDVDNTTVQISAKQDLGSLENELPWGVFQPKCPLKFKGTECLAGQLLSSKSAAYQAATTCNKTINQCVQYDNRQAFQGFTFNAVQGNFRVSERRGGSGGAFLGLIGLGNKRVTKQYSSQDNAPYGKPIPLGLGRTQIEFIPIVSADTGEFMAAEYMIGEGQIVGLPSIRCVSSGWSTSFEFLRSHAGAYGTDTGEQGETGFFQVGNNYSHRAYLEIILRGENPDTGDPVPGIVSSVLWQKIPIFEDAGFSRIDWSDNPVEHLRFLLTEPRSLNYNSAWINDEVAIETLLHCNEPLKDDSGGEDLYISTSAGVPGVDYRRFRSTGLLDGEYFQWILGISDYNYPPERETSYNLFDPASPPAFVTPTVRYRRRYTCNFHIVDRIKAADFVFKHLLPCFRGYLITGGDGRLQIKSERPTITSFLRSTASSGSTTLQVEDVKAWKKLNLPVVFALVGAGQSTSETRVVSSMSYSTAANSITLSASASGSVSATASGSTFAGGSTEVPGEAFVTISGTAAEGNSITVTIDGIPVVLLGDHQDTPAVLAGEMAVRINAHETLNRYVEGIWHKGLPNVTRIRSKLGTLTLATALSSTHSTSHQVAHIHMPFSDVAFGCLTRGNIGQNSFKWPLGSKQSSYNQFVTTYNDAIQDFQSTELRENDYDHQERVNKVNRLEISGTCVDNYHQADRLVKSARYKYRDGDYFNSWTSHGLALLLEEGDIVCTNHSNQPGKRNPLLRIEEMKISQDHRVSITGRLYTETQFLNVAEPTTIPLTTGVGWTGAVPGAVTTVILTSPISGSLSGSFTFSAFIGTQAARIEVMRSGETVFSDTGLRVTPDSSNQGSFSLSGLPSGITYIKIIPYSLSGDGTATISSFDDSAPVIDVLEYQVFDRPEMNLESEVFD